MISVYDAQLTKPHVAFAVGRATGSSVVRHRIRRRLRAALHQLDTHGELLPGLYLVGAGTSIATAPFDHLLRDIRRACTTVSDK